MKGRGTERRVETKRKESFIHWFTVQMGTVTSAGPGQGQELGTPSLAHEWQMPKDLGHLLLLSPVL